MPDKTTASHGMHVLDGILVAQAPDSIEDAALRQFQSGLLRRVHASSPQGVIIDVSRVRLLDSISYALLADSGRMAAMLGAKVVFVGFQPGVVSTLMDLNIDASTLVTALGLEDGMELLRRMLRQAAEEGADDAETDGETRSHEETSAA
jgi:rsbT antagonist protein RsbS